MITASRGKPAGLVHRLNGPLVGRAQERCLLEGLLESVAGGGAATVVAGEAGVGKTALLAHVADVASNRSGLRVLRARGEESEAVLAFAALADLLLPLRERFGELPQAQRQALEVCLALSSGPAAGPLAACAGALGVLASAAEDKPLVVLVDDFQWIDPESQRILLFAARRLATEPIVMILAARDGPGTEVPADGLPMLKIGGLSIAECAELARRVGVTINGPALRSLVEQTGGNPLAVLENLAGAADRMGDFEPPCLALAGAAEGELRAWYLAAAATGKDDVAAEALAAAAADAQQRNGYGASARAWRRAAELTADQDTRARRLLRAATDAHLAGDSETAVAWCEESLQQRHDPAFAADAELILGRARTWRGEPLPAFDGLVRAAAGVRAVDAARAVALLAEATLPAAMAGRVHAVRQVAQQAEELWEGAPAADTGRDLSLTTVAMVAEAFVMAGELDRATRYLDRAEALLPSADLVTEQQGVAFLAQSDVWTERYEQGRLRLGGVVDCGRRMGAPAILALALGLSSELGWWTGRWAPAYADATESLQWAQEMNQIGLIGYGLSLLSRVEAARGDHRQCEEHVERAHRDIGPRGVGCVALYGAAALGLGALTRGELGVAIEHLEHAWAAGEAEGLGNPNVIPFAGDLAEALARAGAADRAGKVLEWLEERADSTGLAYPRAAAARARGILTRGTAEAKTWFALANSVHRRVPMPFEQARTLLCEGEALRRARRPAAARRPLRRALNLFSGLGARPWTARAMSELAATGGPAGVQSQTSSAVMDTLSPQELQVARTVGRGLNNVEAAAALFVSRKTVEAHLTRVYRKLGVRSRTELARLLLTRDLRG